MQKIYIDVTNVLQVNFVTGIQRVVRSVILEMMERIPERLELLALTPQMNSFSVLDKKLFVEYIRGECEEKPKVYGKKIIRPSEIKAGNIFFDLDSVWNSSYKRSTLLPELKNAGVKLAVYIYDIIPITEPQFCHVTTAFNFMDYLGAYLQYADILIASAQSTLDEIYKLMDRLGLKHIPGYVSWLGSDFDKTAKMNSKDVPRDVKKAASGKYVLCIGTIEPRKNHKLLLDAFEQELFSKGIRLIFAGKIGWNVEALEKRIKENKYLGKQFFHFAGLNDAAIDYLYRHAYMVAFPTYNEGFGLPIIEALERGVPVLASRKPVLEEVGRDYCGYFDPDSPQEFIELLNHYLDNPDEYAGMIEHIKEFKPFTWSETADRIIEALESLQIKEYTPKQDLKQMVILTARPDAIGESLRFIDHFMAFIDEVVICCPDSETEAMKRSYHGRMKIVILTDNQLLNGRPLPKDHEQRNFLLRCLAMRSDVLDEVFIMSDDDYRPLKRIEKWQFVTAQQYRAYYFAYLDRWHGTAGNMTSYDYGMFKTRDFLRKQHYPCKQYSAHMPQIIDKRLYREMLDAHPGIEDMGLCEWSSYFNYVQYHYPNLISSEPYVTMGWPGSGTDWRIDVPPQDMLFENYYESLYEQGGLFEGFSQTYYEGIEAENQRKVAKARTELNQYIMWQEQFEQYRRKYIVEYGEVPSFGIRCENGHVYIDVPQVIEIPVGGFIRVPFYLVNPEKVELNVNYRICDAEGKTVIGGTAFVVEKGIEYFELPVFGITKNNRPGRYMLTVFATGNEINCEKTLVAICA